MANYATPAELRADIGQETADDTVLGRILDAAQIKIDNLCNRPDGFVADATATARFYKGTGTPVQRIDECVEVTAVGVKDSPSDDETSYTAWTVGTVGTTLLADVFPARGDSENPDYTLPAQCGKPFDLLVVGANGSYSEFTGGKWTSRGGFRPSDFTHRGLPTVKVTAKWGYSVTVPADIKEACIMQAARWYKRLASAMADTLASADLGMLLYREKLDPDIAGILLDGRYVRPAL